jgi:hypothetical protein
MDVLEVKNERDKLKRSILQQLQEFERRTGCKICDLYFTRAESVGVRPYMQDLTIKCIIGD